MLFARLVLGFTGIIFASYGAVCFLDPAIPADLIGISSLQGGGPVEFIAMYGGLQFALGYYLVNCSIKTAKLLEGLQVLAIVTAGLGLARSAGLLRLGVDDYNLYAAIYELTTCTLALLACRLIKGRAQTA